MTKEDLDNILNDSEFTECINDAAPFRIRIIQDIGPRMKEIQKRFVELMTEVDYKDVSNILAKLKLDKKDENAKLDLNVWKKDVMNIFRTTLKSIHPNENQTPTIGMIYVAGKMLNYIGRSDIISSCLSDRNSSLTFAKLEDINNKFNTDDMRAKFKDLFDQADACQGEMCTNADAIKKDIFSRLPSNIAYDSKNNKKGIKPGNFCALVKHKAMSIIKDSEKYTKYIAHQINDTNANIDREEVILGKTKQM